MSNICKTVSLRTRKIKDGHMLSYYLDYYPGYRDESTMKVIRHESLGIYIYAKPKNQTEQKYNLNLTARAEAIRCRRFEAIVNERYDFFDKEKMKGDFLAYFKKLADKYNPQIQISAESETKRSIFREKDKTKRSKKESAQHSKSRNKSFVMTSVSAL